MPNWCYNSLVVSGDPETLDRWLSKLGAEPDGFLSAFYPVDPDKDWYFEQVEKWGTKWDVPVKALELVTELEDSYQVVFETAWSPPVPWLVKVAADYPALHFAMRYIEEGMGFVGATVAQGEIVAVVETDEMPDYPENDDMESCNEWSEACYALRDELGAQAEELFNQRKDGV